MDTELENLVNPGWRDQNKMESLFKLNEYACQFYPERADAALAIVEKLDRVTEAAVDAYCAWEGGLAISERDRRCYETRFAYAAASAIIRELDGPDHLIRAKRLLDKASEGYLDFALAGSWASEYNVDEVIHLATASLVAVFAVDYVGRKIPEIVYFEAQLNSEGYDKYLHDTLTQRDLDVLHEPFNKLVTFCPEPDIGA